MTVQLQTCPLCEAGHLHEHMILEESEYKGVHKQTPMYFAECDACGSEQAGAEHARRNKRAIMAFKKEVDGLLTGMQVRAIRERLRISQAQAAQIFGGGPVAFSKYESDDVMQSEAMDKLLRLADALPAAFNKLLDNAGLQLSSEASALPKWQADFRRLQAVEKPARRPALRVVRTVDAINESELKYA